MAVHGPLTFTFYQFIQTQTVLDEKDECSSLLLIHMKLAWQGSRTRQFLANTLESTATHGNTMSNTP